MRHWIRIIVIGVLNRFRSKADLELQVLALQHQLSVYERHQTKRLVPTRADRLFWILLRLICPRWQEHLRIVQPDTVVRWHRQGFRLFWQWKSQTKKPGRTAIPREVRELIRRMSRENPTWGSPRIQSELQMLGLCVSEATVRKYRIKMPKPPSQSWKTFLHNHARDIIAIDFFVVPTLTFRLLYCLVVLDHDRRKILHTSVTRFPTAEWTARQITEVCSWDTSPKYLLRDNDGIYGEEFLKRLETLGIEDVPIAPRSPWQNAYVERVIGSIRRECFNEIIPISERHAARVLKEYAVYYNASRTHTSLNKDSPLGRTPQTPRDGPRIVALPVLGGLHHRYERRAA